MKLWADVLRNVQFINSIEKHRKLGLRKALVALAWNLESVILSDSASKERVTAVHSGYSFFL